MERVKHTSKNLIFALIYYFVDVILAFGLRTVFVKVFSADLLGVNGLFSNVFSMLSIAELGLGTAISYSMYKPVKDGNIEKVKSLFQLYRKIYLFLFIFIVSVGLLLIPALPYIVKGHEYPINIYAVYIPLLFNTACTYLFAHYKSIFFVYQRNDIESKIKICNVILLKILQVVALITLKNYYVYIVLMPVGTLIEGAICIFYGKKQYKFLSGSYVKVDSETKSEIKKNTVAMFIQKLSSVIIYSTDNIFISTFLGLTLLGIYSNYAMIISTITAIIALIIDSIKASVGNLIAEGDNQKSYDVFRKIMFAHFWLIGFCAICLITLFQPFMQLWLGQSFVLDIWVVLAIVASFYINVSKYTINMYKDAAGLFRKDILRPILESLFNVGLSILLVHYFGLLGIILGTIISAILTTLWMEARVVYKYHFHKNLISYITTYLLYTAVTVLVGGFIYWICSLLPSGLGWFVLRLVINVVGVNALFMLMYCRSSNLKYFINLFTKTLGKIFKRKKNEK